MNFILVISSTHDFGLVTIKKKLLNDEGCFEHPIIILGLLKLSKNKMRNDDVTAHILSFVAQMYQVIHLFI
jgi:hypothetical protein